MIAQHVQLEERPEFVRDTHSKAILANDLTTYKSYLARKRQMRKIHELESHFDEFEGVKNDVESIKKDIKEMKSMLMNIVK